ncbi:MAG: RnfABCDGE type electron transport complex subunit G [Chlorobi bacterium]|nr:RnfABCDGE type electron transport complex subunit G [Chlorobiota bacterium]
MRPIITLTLVGLIAAALLAIVDDLTRDPIALAKAEMKRKAIEEIFPFDIDSLKNVETKKTRFYEAYDRNGTLKGIAVESATTIGYSGKIEILLGVSPEQKIYDYKVVYHLETPGLGDKIDKAKFKEQFRGRALEGTTWKVKKDGGEIDELTAATISSRAVTDAVQRGLQYINEQYPKTEGK